MKSSRIKWPWQRHCNVSMQADMFAPRFKDEQVSNQTVSWGKACNDDRQLWIEG
jgi:hypothetical protein